MPRGVYERDAYSLARRTAIAVGKQARGVPGVAAQRSLYRAYQSNSKRRGHVWELSFEKFVSLCQSPCRYCGAAPQQSRVARSRIPGRTNGEFVYNGIDRQYNDEGYTLVNSVPCCRACNYAKSNRDFLEWMAWIDQVAIHNA